MRHRLVLEVLRRLVETVCNIGSKRMVRMAVERLGVNEFERG